MISISAIVIDIVTNTTITILTTTSIMTIITTISTTIVPAAVIRRGPVGSFDRALEARATVMNIIISISCMCIISTTIRLLRLLLLLLLLLIRLLLLLLQLLLLLLLAEGPSGPSTEPSRGARRTFDVQQLRFVLC